MIFKYYLFGICKVKKNQKYASHAGGAYMQLRQAAIGSTPIEWLF